MAPPPLRAYPPRSAQKKMFIQLSTIPWFDLIQTVSAVAIIIIAWMALQTWKDENKASKRTDFLDELADSALEYINRIDSAVSMLGLIKFDLSNHVVVGEEFNSYDNPKLVSFIKTYGRKYGDTLSKTLEDSQNSLAKLGALNAKGKIYDFEDYDVSRDAYRGLAKQHRRMQNLSVILRLHPNWENEKVCSVVEEIARLDPDDIKKELYRNRESLLVFALKFNQDTYSTT